jgi:hypothetical protein
MNTSKGSGRWRTVIRIVILLLIFYAVFKGFLYWLDWHFDHPIVPKEQ